MTFDELLAQVLDLLQRQGRVSYGALKRRFDLRGLDPEAAQQLLDPAIHCMMDAVHRFEGTVNQVLGDGIIALFGAPIAHEAHYQQALALAEELGMRPLVAHCHRGLGMLYATTAQHEQARAALSIAIELYRAMDMTFWLPQAQTGLAQMQ
jgi:class 3 adenylate cyclase